jgi:hypothetical protein
LLTQIAPPPAAPEAELEVNEQDLTVSVPSVTDRAPPFSKAVFLRKVELTMEIKEKTGGCGRAW